MSRADTGSQRDSRRAIVPAARFFGARDGKTHMMMSDSFLSNAGWLFLALWSLVVSAVGVVAFGHDLFLREEKQPSDPARSAKQEHDNNFARRVST